MPLATTGDRVQETSAVTGLGPVTLLGAVPGWRSFDAAFGTGVQLYYAIEHTEVGAWEVGEGRLSDATTLVRDRVISSSAGGAPVSFIAGVKRVFATVPAEMARGDDASLATLLWGTPGAEAGNAIEVPATLLDAAGQPFASALADVEVRVTDGAADAEPSATATLSAAAAPVGTVLAGTGTATLVARTDAAGALRVRVSEAAAGFRYLWVRPAGHARLRVRSAGGVLELTFA